MTKIELSAEQKSQFVKKLQDYVANEFEFELGQFDGEFFLDFIAKELGNVFYNQGLYDAQAILESRIDSISEAIAEIEK